MKLKKHFMTVIAISLLAVCAGCGVKLDEAAISKAEEYGRGARYDEAISEFTKAIKIRPTAKAYVSRGATHAAKGDMDSAITDFTSAIVVDPAYPEAYVSRGLACAYKGEVELGIEDCNKAVEIKPDYAAAYNTRAMIYFMGKKFDRSWEDVLLAESLGYKVNPNFIDALKRASGRR